MDVFLVSMVLDYMIGDPLSWPHPVIYIGRLINRIEKTLIKRRHQKACGILMVVIVLVVIYGTVELFSIAAGFNTYLYGLFLCYGIYSAIAYRALIKAGDAVYRALLDGTIEEARVKLSYIVGRDTKALNEEQIIKATVETVAENTIDGIVAPLFYGVLGYFICQRPIHFMWLYKGINTMDSMVGYMNDHYKDYGFGAAKLDDFANYIPGRVGSLLMLITSIGFLDIRNGFRIYLRDRYNHKSPNAGHPESAVAGLLNIQLGGNSSYFNRIVEKPVIGDPNRCVLISDIKESERILTRTYIFIYITVLVYEGCRRNYGF